MKLKNEQKISSGALWLITPITIIFTAIILLSFNSQDDWSWIKILFVAGCILVSILLLLTCIDQEAFWWSPRLLAFMFFSALFAGMIYVLSTDNDVNIMGKIALPIATLAFGLPGLMFALWGNAKGNIEKNLNVQPEDITTRKQALKWLSTYFLGLIIIVATFLYVLLMIVRMFNLGF